MVKTKSARSILTKEIIEITLKRSTLAVVNPAIIKTDATIKSKPRKAMPSLSHSIVKEAAIATTANMRHKTANTVARTGNFLNSY